jgi:hypothetical protein
MGLIKYSNGSLQQPKDASKDPSKREPHVHDFCLNVGDRHVCACGAIGPSAVVDQD